MAKLRVTIIDEVRNRRLKVDLPDDAAMEKLLPALAKKLDLPSADYRLTHEVTGRALGSDQTLASFGMREGDALRLTAARKEVPTMPRKLPVWAWIGIVVVVLLAVAARAFLVGQTLKLVLTDDTVLFTSDRDGKREIYRLTGTGEVERVTYTPSNGESWSPVPELGGTVLFTSDRDGKQEIYRLTGTGEVVQITHTPGDGESWLPAH